MRETNGGPWQPGGDPSDNTLNSLAVCRSLPSGPEMRQGPGVRTRSHFQSAQPPTFLSFLLHLSHQQLLLETSPALQGGISERDALGFRAQPETQRIQRQGCSPDSSLLGLGGRGGDILWLTSNYRAAMITAQILLRCTGVWPGVAGQGGASGERRRWKAGQMLT